MQTSYTKEQLVDLLLMDLEMDIAISKFCAYT
jgi:hypothetical protein